jgi:hypothetical protein
MHKAFGGISTDEGVGHQYAPVLLWWRILAYGLVMRISVNSVVDGIGTSSSTRAARYVISSRTEWFALAYRTQLQLCMGIDMGRAMNADEDLPLLPLLDQLIRNHNDTCALSLQIPCLPASERCWKTVTTDIVGPKPSTSKSPSTLATKMPITTHSHICGHRFFGYVAPFPVLDGRNHVREAGERLVIDSNDRLLHSCTLPSFQILILVGSFM